MDQELIAYLDARFREATQQVESLREETTQQIGSLRDEFGSLRDEFGSLRGEFESFREETTQNFGRVDEGIRQVHVVIEGLRNGEVRVVSEGVSGFKEQLSDFRAEVSQEFDAVRGLVRSTYTELDRRIRPLEIRKVRKS